MQQQSTGNKLFTLEGTDESGRPIYSPAPQVQQVCQVVDGFIYVANAEPGRGKIRLPFCFLPFAAAINHFCVVLPRQHLPLVSQVRENLSWVTFRLC